jgi:hypothetical protein
LYMLLALPVQSFWDPSPLGLATIFYCLRFETSLFVASYDSQSRGGGIRPRLHMGLFRLLRQSSLSYKPSVRQRKTHLASLLRKHRVYRRCWATLPKVVYCCVATTTLRLGSARRNTALHTVA